MTILVDGIRRDGVGQNQYDDGVPIIFGSRDDVAMVFVRNASGGYFIAQDGSLVIPPGVADPAAAIAAAAAALPSTGGVIDGRALSGTVTLATDPFASVTKPFALLTGRATWVIDKLSLASHSRIHASGTTFRHATGQATSGQYGLFTPRTYGTTGSITTGTNLLTVLSTTGIEVGAVIGIVGAEGGNPYQYMHISNGGMAISAGASTIPVDSVSGLSAGGAWYFLIGSEIIMVTLDGTTTLANVTRGALGTTPASHADGATVSFVGYFITQVTAINGLVLTLADNATFTVASAPVLAGVVDVQLSGDAIVDGNRQVAVPPAGTHLYGFYGYFTSGVQTPRTWYWENIDHVGIALWSGRQSDIDGVFQNIGRPSSSIGFDTSLFGRCKDVTVLGTYRGAGWIASSIDGRTQTMDLQSGPASRCLLLPRVIGNANGQYTYALDLNDCADCNVDAGPAKASTIVRMTSDQWVTAPGILRTTVILGRADGGTFVVDMAAGSINGSNTVLLNDRVATAKIVAQDGNRIRYVRMDDSTESVSDLGISLDGSAQKFIKVRGGDASTNLLQFEFPDLDTQGAEVRFFRDTSTLGSLAFRIFKGDGTVTVEHHLSAKDRSYVGAQGHNFGVAGITNPLRPLSVLGKIASFALAGDSTPAAEMDEKGLRLMKRVDAIAYPGAGYGLIRWETGTNAGTLKLVAYAGTGAPGVTVVDNVGSGN